MSLPVISVKSSNRNLLRLPTGWGDASEKNSGRSSLTRNRRAAALFVACSGPKVKRAAPTRSGALSRSHGHGHRRVQAQGAVWRGELGGATWLLEPKRPCSCRASRSQSLLSLQQPRTQRSGTWSRTITKMKWPPYPTVAAFWKPTNNDRLAIQLVPQKHSRHTVVE